MMRTHLRDELELLMSVAAFTEADLAEVNARGHDASFIRQKA
jgi:hypothetical protein